MKTRAVTELVKGEFESIQNFLSVELYAGQFDDARKLINRLPGLLLLVDDTPLDKLDHDYDKTVYYKALLIHSDKSSEEKQVLEMLDLVDSVVDCVKDIRGMKLINYRPVESSKAVIVYEVNFKYEERI